MAKFLKRNRVESIKSSKFARYLIYVIGEILIVVVGIITAIYLNNANDKHAKRELVDKLFDDVEYQTSKYIKSASFFVNFNAQRDSLAKKVLNNTAQIKDYKAGGYHYLYILRLITDLNFDFPFLDQLKENADYLNDQEKIIYNQLVKLNSLEDIVKPFSEQVAQTLQDHRRYEIENLEWYHLALNGDSTALNKELDFRKTSYRYKNFLADFARYEIHTKSGFYLEYQCLAARILLKLNELRNGETLTSDQIESVLSKNNLKRLPNINCEEDTEALEYQMFAGVDMSNFIYNASKDTITIQNETKDRLIGKLPPNKSYILKETMGTTFGVYLDDRCVSKYQTVISGYILHD